MLGREFCPIDVESFWALIPRIGSSNSLSLGIPALKREVKLRKVEEIVAREYLLAFDLIWVNSANVEL